MTPLLPRRRVVVSVRLVGQEEILEQFECLFGGERRGELTFDPLEALVLASQDSGELATLASLVEVERSERDCKY